MADIEQYKKAIIQAHEAGDYEGAQVLADRLKTLQAAQPEPSLAEQAGGLLETAATIGSSLIAEPVSGLAGIAQSLNPFAEEGAGAEAVSDVREALTYQPRGETGQRYLKNVGETLQPVGEVFQQAEQYLGDTAMEATGSPVVAAAATAVPTAITELAGLGAGKRAVTSTARRTAKAERGLQDVKDLASGKSSTETISQGVKTVESGTPEEVLQMAQLDPEFFRAADELGISTEPLAAFASESSQFRDISGALRSVPGSMLDVQARDFIKQTADSADNLIQQYGGTLDKAELDNRFKNDSLRVIDDLADEADNLYSEVRQQLPPQSRAIPSNTLSFLDGVAEDLGGVDNLPPELKGLYESISKDGGPTIGLIDLKRKEFGQATRKGGGRFKDVESGIAKAIYNRLSSDLDVVAESAGLQDLTNLAKETVKRRKVMEDNLTKLYGRDLNKSLGDTVGASIKGLAKGRVDQFSEVMRSIPKEKRGEVVLSYMNDVFKGTGADQQSLNATQFTKWYDTINRSPRVKSALYANLPKESRKAIDNLYKVSKGISRSQSQTVKTGAINSLFNNDTGFVRKLVGNSAAQVAGRVLGGPAGSLAFDATTEFLSQSSNSAKRASDMLASPQFQDLVRKAVTDGIVDATNINKKLKEAERRVMQTKKYQRWAESLDADSKSALAGGLIPYLFKQEDQDEQQ